MRANQIKELVKGHYSKHCMVELERLTNDPYHRLEYDTTMYFLKRYLPKRGSVLDAGGGPGSYTIVLAKMGYDVTLVDLTPKLLEMAERHVRKAKVEGKVKNVIEGSIDDLSMFKDDSFDAVICLGGTLGHLTRKRLRQKAADELIRVAKCNAPIFVSVIGRLAILMNTVVYLWPELKKAPDIWRKYVTIGDYFGGYGFTACHFYIPEELRAEFEGRVRMIATVGLEGIFSTHEKEYNKVYKLGKYNETLWDMHLKTCTNPSVVEISEHFMMICKKLASP